MSGFHSHCAFWLISPWAGLWLIMSNISYHQCIPSSHKVLTYICQQIQVFSVHIGKIWISLRSYSHFIVGMQKKPIKMKTSIAYHLLGTENSWNIWWPSVSRLKIKWISQHTKEIISTNNQNTLAQNVNTTADLPGQSKKQERQSNYENSYPCWSKISCTELE